jgi:uncharacterized protein
MGSRTVPLRLILCGSAISVMGDLLSGTKALRGRGALELRIRPFGYREAREYRAVENPAAAFTHNAVIGGTPGYRELVPDPQVPEDAGRGPQVRRSRSSARPSTVTADRV